MEPNATTVFTPGTSVICSRSTGEPVPGQVVGYSEHGDAHRRITYEHSDKLYFTRDILAGKWVLKDLLAPVSAKPPAKRATPLPKGAVQSGGKW